MDFLDMILIVDAGATKTRWCFADSSGYEVQTLVTDGINASTMTTESITAIVDNVFELVPVDMLQRISAIHYYGAGVVSAEQRVSISKLLSRLSSTAILETHGDMLGAARALLGDSPGVACILGTGSNSCLYDGNLIVDNVPALGYILGDEGRGASLGKRFLSDLFKRFYPACLMAEWQTEMGLTMADVVERVYRRPGANSFLGSVVPFIKKNMHYSEVRSMVIDEFGRFFDRNVMKYHIDSPAIGVVGSIGKYFEVELADVALSRGCRLVKIVADPMPELVKYHTRKNLTK